MESESDHLLSLYYLVAWKGYPKEKNTWKTFLVVQHLKKLIRLFHKNHSEKLTATFLHINSALAMARPTVKSTAKSITKRKQSRPVNSTNKWAKKNWSFYLFFHLSSPWPIRLFVHSIFIKKRQFSSSNHPIRLRDFLSTISLSKDFFYLSIFLPQASLQD